MLQQIRKGYEIGRSRVDFDKAAFALGVDQSLRLDCNAKVDGESSYSPVGHTALEWAIENEIVLESGGSFGSMNSVQASNLNRIMKHSLKKYGLCSWMLHIAKKESSLSYLLRLRADDAERQPMSHFVYLTLRIKELGSKYQPMRQLNK